MDSAKQISIRLWGTRGTVTPLLPSREFGTHTTAAEVLVPGKPSMFLDMGTGIVPASERALKTGRRTFDIYMSHFHVDHLFGLFSFAPFYVPDCTVIIHGTRPDMPHVLGDLLRPPYYPVRFAALPATVLFDQIPEHGSRDLVGHGFRLTWGSVSHPQGGTAFRIDDGENALVFATDVELGEGMPNEDLERMLAEPFPAGLFVVDGFFEDEDIDFQKNWGHSTWEQARATGRSAGVGTIVVTHHHPKYADEDLRRMETSAGDIRWAREGQVWTLRNNDARAH